MSDRAPSVSTGIELRVPIPTRLDEPGAAWTRWLTTTSGESIDASHPLAALLDGSTSGSWSDVVYTGGQAWWVRARSDGEQVEIRSTMLGDARGGSEHPTTVHRDVMGQVLGSEELARADELFRGTVENLHQAIYLYEPIWEHDRIVDLEITYCNAAALALPFTESIVVGALASNVFENPALAMLEAEQAWTRGHTTPYSIERSGLVDGAERTIRYEIRTIRVGDHILQTSTDHTVADDLRRAESRQRLILDALSEGVTLLAPVFDDQQHLASTRVLYRNRAADRFRLNRVFEGSTADQLAVTKAAWDSDVPVSTSIDRVNSLDSGAPQHFFELEAVRVGELLVQVVRDRTQEMLFANQNALSERRFRGMLDALEEAVGIWFPLRDGDGRIEDFMLRYTNPALGRHVSTGVLASALPTDVGVVADACAAALNGTHVTAKVAVSNAADAAVWRTTFVCVEGEVIAIGKDIAESHRLLARLSASESILRQAMITLDASIRG